MVQCAADINVLVEAILDNDLKEVEDKKNMIRFSLLVLLSLFFLGVVAVLIYHQLLVHRYLLMLLPRRCYWYYFNSIFSFA